MASWWQFSTHSLTSVALLFVVVEEVVVKSEDKVSKCL